MGDIVSTGQSLMITIFSMAVVFLVLIAISFLIEALRMAINGKGLEAEKKKTVKEIKKEEEKKPEESIGSQDDKELIAVIAGAIAASLGKDIPSIKIKTIRRIHPSNLWSEAGRSEQVLSRL